MWPGDKEDCAWASWVIQRSTLVVERKTPHQIPESHRIGEGWLFKLKSDYYQQNEEKVLMQISPSIPDTLTLTITHTYLLRMPPYWVSNLPTPNHTTTSTLLTKQKKIRRIFSKEFQQTRTS
jgi:hypothetical protein